MWMPAPRALHLFRRTGERSARSDTRGSATALILWLGDFFPSLSALGSEIPPQLPATQLGQRSNPSATPARASVLQSWLSRDGGVRVGNRGDAAQSGTPEIHGDLRAGPTEQPRVPEPGQKGGRKATVLRSGQANGVTRSRVPWSAPPPSPRGRMRRGYLLNCSPVFTFRPPFPLIPRNGFPLPPPAGPGPSWPARSG